MSRRLFAFAFISSLALSACAPSDDGGLVRPPAAAPLVTPNAAPAATSDAAAKVEPSSLLGGGDFVAVPRERLLPMWHRPAGAEHADFKLDTQNATGRIAPLLVEDAKRLGGDAWYEVLLPIRPNGATAWARARDVRIRGATDRIEVDLSRRLLWHYVDGELAERLDVGVGTPLTPTAVGRFFVWVKVWYSNENGPFGFLALGLSGFSPVISEWPGGGRMAVHGTVDPDDRGRAVSHGCVRVYNGDLDALSQVPLGTPVVIRA
ncbi:MAG: L,D-transpeptidase [Actinomycetota bacterium]